MNLFATLLLAHLLADFPLQTNSIFRLKQQGNIGILLHVMVHIVVTIILLKDPFSQWGLLLGLGVIHFAIDWYKVKSGNNFSVNGFLSDQMAHVCSIIFLSFLAQSGSGLLPSTVLYVAMVVAILPAIMMLCWIYAGTQTNGSTLTIWTQKSMLPWSQKTGLVIALAVAGSILTLAY